MSLQDRERWNAKYLQATCGPAERPDSWLVEVVSRLPPGRALDVACGTGRTALWLAARGWSVVGIEISDIGLSRARERAAHERLAIDWRLADLDDCDLGTEEFDLIVVLRYLDRESLPARLCAALRPGGLLLTETFSKAPASAMSGAAASGTPVLGRQKLGRQKNPAFVLQPGEFREMYPDLRVLTDEIVTIDGDWLARFVGQKC